MIAVRGRAHDFETQSMKLAASAVLATQACGDELRAAALELMAQLVSGELDEYEERSTCALLAEILFPDADAGRADPAESEEQAASQDPQVAEVLAEMDLREASFAERLRSIMDGKGMTQSELAAKVGIGQPAISMMLNRACRPQKKTVHKLAPALGVDAAELWPV